MAGDITGFLEKSTAGIPNWGWAAIIVLGIGAAYFVPKLLNIKSPTNMSENTAPTTGSVPDSGLGLAIDPTTGLPYAVEGLVPQGSNTYVPPAQSTPPPPPTPTPTPTCKTGFHFQSGQLGQPIPNGSYSVQGGYCVPDTIVSPPQPSPKPTPSPPPTPQKFVIVQKWPDPLSTLWGISQKYGLSLQRIEQLNPQIKDPNLIYPGQQVRIA